jgi:DNA-binding Lrp family transcriptional regulator
MRLDRTDREIVRALQADARLTNRDPAQRAAIARYHPAGRLDFVAHVGVRDAAHLRSFGCEAITFRQTIGQAETRLVFDTVPSWVLPWLAPERDDG